MTFYYEIDLFRFTQFLKPVNSKRTGYTDKETVSV